MTLALPDLYVINTDLSGSGPLYLETTGTLTFVV